MGCSNAALICCCCCCCAALQLLQCILGLHRRMHRIKQPLLHHVVEAPVAASWSPVGAARDPAAAGDTAAAATTAMPQSLCRLSDGAFRDTAGDSSSNSSSSRRLLRQTSLRHSFRPEISSSISSSQAETLLASSGELLLLLQVSPPFICSDSSLHRRCMSSNCCSCYCPLYTGTSVSFLCCCCRFIAASPVCWMVQQPLQLG